MDPNAALRALREYAEHIVETHALQSDNSREMAASFQALDGWLSSGGFTPDDWKTGERS